MVSATSTSRICQTAIIFSLPCTLRSSWNPILVLCHGKITLLHKWGEQSWPSNYRLIVLSSIMGKLFYRSWLLGWKFCFSNDIINPSIQKGFQRGMNGTMEHIFAIISILDNAWSNGLPLTIFLDLKNTFRSISHLLIKDIMSHLSLPYKVTTYISDIYSKLTTFLHTKVWVYQRISNLLWCFSKGYHVPNYFPRENSRDIRVPRVYIQDPDSRFRESR